MKKRSKISGKVVADILFHADCKCCVCKGPDSPETFAVRENYEPFISIFALPYFRSSRYGKCNECFTSQQSSLNWSGVCKHNIKSSYSSRKTNLLFEPRRPLFLLPYPFKSYIKSRFLPQNTYTTF